MSEFPEWNPETGTKGYVPGKSRCQVSGHRSQELGFGLFSGYARFTGRRSCTTMEAAGMPSFFSHVL